MTLADGGRCDSHLVALVHSWRCSGCSSVATAQRVLLSIGAAELDRLRATRAGQLAGVASGAAPEQVMLEFDATPISAEEIHAPRCHQRLYWSSRTCALKEIGIARAPYAVRASVTRSTRRSRFRAVAPDRIGEHSL